MISKILLYWQFSLHNKIKITNAFFLIFLSCTCQFSCLHHKNGTMCFALYVKTWKEISRTQRVGRILDAKGPAGPQLEINQVTNRCYIIPILSNSGYYMLSLKACYRVLSIMQKICLLCRHIQKQKKLGK